MCKRVCCGGGDLSNDYVRYLPLVFLPPDFSIFSGRVGNVHFLQHCTQCHYGYRIKFVTLPGITWSHFSKQKKRPQSIVPGLMVWTDWTDKSLLYLRDLLLLHLLHSVLPLAAMACTTLQGSSLPPSVVTGHVTTSQRAPLDCCEGFWCLAGFEVLCARSAAASLFFNA